MAQQGGVVALLDVGVGLRPRADALDEVVLVPLVALWAVAEID